MSAIKGSSSPSQRHRRTYTHAGLAVVKDDGDDATRLREIRDDIVSLLAFYSFYSVKAFSRGRKRNGRKRLPRHGWLQPSPAAVFSFQLGIVSFFAPFVNA